MNNVSSHTDSSALKRRILIGAGIATALILFFLITAGEPNPEWGKFWRIKPLIIVPLAGAFGGGLFHYANQFIGGEKIWTRIAAFLIGAIAFIITLWMGTVLGLNGTYWN